VKKSNIFKIVEPNPTIETEAIARQLVRNLNSATEFRALPTKEDTWTQLKVNVYKDKKYIFKQIKEYPLIETDTGFIIYINNNTTSIDVRVFTGKIIEYAKKPKITYYYLFKQKLALVLYKLAKHIYTTGAK
jgi:Uma2 family endonuclease